MKTIMITQTIIIITSMMMKIVFLISFSSLYCDEGQQYIKFTKIICSEHLSQRNLVTCKYCQNDFTTREVRCSVFCWSIQGNIKKYTLDELGKIANLYIKRRKKEYIIDDFVRKVVNEILLKNKEAFD